MKATRGSRSVVAIALAVAAGIAVDLLVARATGKREPWDTSAFWVLGYPALILVSAVLGFRWPGSARQAGFSASIALMITMMLRTGGGSLWPLGLVLGAALGVPCALAAHAGARMRGPARPTTP
jgi:hypothetical protein